MGIRRIDERLCNGCRICVDICPMDTLRMSEETNKPVIQYLKECQACFLCERDCPQEAIYVTPDREKRIILPY
jgi:NAD-dependent dihydropyrimidine dehydrogenase PreA subunit